MIGGRVAVGLLAWSHGNMPPVEGAGHLGTRIGSVETVEGHASFRGIAARFAQPPVQRRKGRGYQVGLARRPSEQAGDSVERNSGFLLPMRVRMYGAH